MTQRACISQSEPICLTVMPVTFPSSVITPTHPALIIIRTPDDAALPARNLSKRCLSRTYPTSEPSGHSRTFNVLPEGDLSIVPEIFADIHPGSGSMPASNSLLLDTPSAHLRGAPISAFFSTSITRAPPSAACFAAMLPAGPAPTTTTSQS